MLKIILIVLAFVFAGTEAEGAAAPKAQDEGPTMVLRHPEGEATLLSARCANPDLLARIHPTVRAGARQAREVFRGIHSVGCWVLHEGEVYFAWDSGNSTRLDLDDFKPGNR